MAQSTSRSCLVIGNEPPMEYEGTMEQSYRPGKEYAAFIGVPYADPPEGLGRYQKAKSFNPVKPPDQSLPTYKADVKGKMSAQLLSETPKGSSDCLYLNIFLPKRPEEITELLPVLVYIHGGGFTSGSNDPEEYSPDFIVHEGLCFVTVNYRLGIFGFLNAPVGVCPGNAGLKDQVKALQWIQDNIACFKGDPSNVTISGCSSGGTCINMHLIAPQSKDLFHKAIVQSGGVFCPWGFRGYQRDRNRVLSNDEEFQRLLLARNESWDLQKRGRDLLDMNFHNRNPESLGPLFGPTVEKSKEDAFVTGSVEDMMKRADHDKPVMAGIAKAEGLAVFTVENPGLMYRDWMRNDNRKFRRALMDNFRWAVQTADMFVEEIRDKYFPNRYSTSYAQKIRHLANFIRDVQFRRFYDNFKFGPEETLHKNLYVYRFDHVSAFSAVERYAMADIYDAAHGDELKYLYPRLNLAKYVMQKKPIEFQEIEVVINHICSLWANFCKTGVPKSDSDASNTVWRKHTEENPCFLSIGKNLRLIEERLFQEEWDWLNERVNPAPTIDSPPDTP